MVNTTNTTINARDELIAKLYQKLRLDDENEPLRDETLRLYNQITLELIEVTEKIYGKSETKDEDEDKSQDKENAEIHRSDIKQPSGGVDD
jgi:hypothetical protein